MAKLFILVTSISLPDPYDEVAMEGTVRLEDSGPAGGYSWAANYDVGASQNDIKAACVSAAEAVATAHSLSYSGSIIVGWPDEAGTVDLSGLCAVPGAGSSISLALATPRRPSTTRPTTVTAYGSFTLATALLAAQGATVQMQSDSSATPTTVVGGPLTVNNGVGTVGTAVVPWMMEYDVPAGHYYQIVQSATVGTGAASITHINEQVL